MKIANATPEPFSAPEADVLRLSNAFLATFNEAVDMCGSQQLTIMAMCHALGSAMGQSFCFIPLDAPVDQVLPPFVAGYRSGQAKVFAS